jgi:hypothetical protein
VGDEQSGFLSRIEGWVTDALDAAPNLSFGALVAGLPGVTPGVAVDVLRQMAAGKGPYARKAKDLIEGCAETEPTTAVTAYRPIPHPLDYFWAYSPESIERLSAILLARTSPGDEIVYLGTPNAFNAAAAVMADRSHVLLDRREVGGDSQQDGNRRFARVDLLADDVPRLGADAAILDPPWYPDDMCGFLWAAAAAAEPGAQIWMSSPPVGTRPKAEREISEVIEWAARAGLELVERLDGVIRYLSPPFELSSHRAAHLGGVPLDWRTGDLLQFRVLSPLACARPPTAAGDVSWRRFVIDEIPIWVKIRPDASAAIGNQLLRGIASEDVLQTVSRRDPTRKEVDLWTSLNRVWASSHPAALAEVCGCLEAGDGQPDAAVATRLERDLSVGEREHVRRLAEDLKKTVSREREEHGM